MKKFTNVSNYQKKLAAIAVCGALVISGVSFSMSQADASTAAALIGMGKGADIALSDAGLKENQVNDLTAKYRTENGVSFYTVTFTSGSYTYEYRVNAVDGSILQANRNAVTQATENGPTTGSQTTTTKKITNAKAKSIALKHAGVSASKATFVKAKLDYEDGRRVYEIEFYSGNTEYDYEILASNGKIISYDKDIENYKIPRKNTSSSTYIGKAKAKSIALKDAGVSASSATFTTTKLDYEDGSRVYEIEFYTKSAEYEYEINAKTGKIRDMDVEHFDYDDDWD